MESHKSAGQLTSEEIMQSEDFLYLLRKNKPEDNTADKYLSAFSKRNSFNWSAFFFQYYWFAYRHMSGKAILYFLLYIVLYLLFAPVFAVVYSFFSASCRDTSHSFLIFHMTVYNSVLSILYSAVLGLIANREYKSSLIDKCRKAVTLPPEKRHEYLDKYKGTGPGWLWLLLAAALFIAVIAAAAYAF